MTGPPWWQRAACRGVTTAAEQPFDLDVSAQTGPTVLTRAKARALIAEYCDRCPVAAQCLADARDGRTLSTVRGGRLFNSAGLAVEVGEQRRCERCGTPLLYADRRPCCGACVPPRHRHGPAPAPIRHGTTSGYRGHLRDGQKPCDDCRAARTEYDRARKYRETG